MVSLMARIAEPVAVVCDGAAASASSSDTRGPTPACNAACSTSAQTSAPYSAGTHATRPPDGSENDLHQRLVKARDTMRLRIREQAMFTFMDPELGTATSVPTANNAIESQNARIRDMLPPSRPMPDPARQDRVPVVLPTRHAPRNPSMAHQTRMKRRAGRTAPPTGKGTQQRGTTGATRHPRQIRHRHRLERIPHQHTMEEHQLTRHTFWAYTQNFPHVLCQCIVYVLSA